MMSSWIWFTRRDIYLLFTCGEEYCLRNTKYKKMYICISMVSSTCIVRMPFPLIIKNPECLKTGQLHLTTTVDQFLPKLRMADPDAARRQKMRGNLYLVYKSVTWWYFLWGNFWGEIIVAIFLFIFLKFNPFGCVFENKYLDTA